MNWLSPHHLKAVAYTGGLTLASSAFAQDSSMQEFSDAGIAEWLGNLFFLSLAVMAIFMHWAGHTVTKGVKPKVKAKYGKYAGIIALFFDDAVQDDYLKKRSKLAVYVRFFAIAAILLFLSHLYLKQ